jgi:hypothetical protein
MKKQEFIRKYFIEMANNYYSRYDIVEKGFAYQDAGYYSLEKIDEEYEKFLKDEEEWIRGYQW